MHMALLSHFQASTKRKYILNGNKPWLTTYRYKPGFFSRVFKRTKDVHAVVDMNLDAYPGQILCLLGPNGSGKSTTMNCIAGQHKVTAGNVIIDPTGGLGYAPQSNVIW